jgi:hypothetical protein
MQNRARLKCDFVEHRRGFQCRRCGKVVRTAQKPVAVCGSTPRAGLGDMVAAGLQAVGITPARVSAVTGRPCGCKKRQEKLNELGRKFGIG